MLDVDHFKELNDKFGHAAGDECLRSFGEMLIDFETIHNMRFFRYGGEEFVGLVFDCERDKLPALADNIRVATQEKNLGNNHFTVSIGTAYCDDAGVDCETWIARADDAVYKAKDKGRNSVVYWNDAFSAVNV